MNTNNKIYLDANFLTFWALPKDEEIKKKVRILLAMFLTRRATITTSCLALDEMWFSVKRTYNGLNNETKSCSDEPICSLFSNFTVELLNKVILLQFDNPNEGTKKALDHIKNFKLKPRDAFHLALMNNHSILEIVTDDSDFKNIADVAGIQVSF